MNKIKILVTCLLLTLVSLPKDSKAAFSITASGGTSYFFAEAMILPLGFGGYLLTNRCRVTLCLDKALGVALVGLGIVLLDENAGNIEFNSIDDKNAKRIGLTQEEQDAFNNSLDEINFVKDEISMELLKIEEPTLEDANRMWDESSDLIDADAFNALTKVKNSIANSIK